MEWSSESSSSVSCDLSQASTGHLHASVARLQTSPTSDERGKSLPTARTRTRLMFDTRFRICFMGPLRCTRQRDNLSPLSSQLQHRLVIVQMAVQQRWSAGGAKGIFALAWTSRSRFGCRYGWEHERCAFSNSSQPVDKDRLKPHVAFHDPFWRLETCSEVSELLARCVGGAASWSVLQQQRSCRR